MRNEPDFAGDQNLPPMHEDLSGTMAEPVAVRGPSPSPDEPLRLDAGDASAFLAAVVASSQDSVIGIDLAQTITAWNPAAERLYGYPATEALGKPLTTLALPREIVEVIRRAARNVQGRTVEPSDTIHVQKDGRALWLSVTSRPARNDRGEVIGACVVARDVTTRRGEDATARGTVEQLRLIVENAREYAIFSLDLGRRITSWNSGARHILGYTHEEALGRSGDMIFTPEERADGAPEQEANTALAGGRAVDERWHVRKDGSRFWGSGVMMAMRDARQDAIGLVKIFRDQTEEVLARKALEQSRAELEEALRKTEQARRAAEVANETKNHFVAVLSHELRTPLAPITIALGTLLRRHDLPPPVRRAHEMILRNVRLEAHFIDDLLDLTRIERGKMEVVRAPMDLHEAIERAVEISLPDIEARHQTLGVVLDAANHRVNGDFARLQQALWNLLKNASKFTPPGGSIGLRSSNEAAKIVVEVTDTGIGMEADAVTRIFNPFEQADPAITRQFGGLGLGLAIAKATVDAHEGTLRASSPGRNHGATFALSLSLLAPPP